MYGKTITFKHGFKSYDIIEYILNTLFPMRYDLTILDLTYGKGRFYRKVRHRIKKLIAVDIYRHEWEVKPDMFYLMPCQFFTMEVIEGKIQLPVIDLIVVDPPWNKEKRGPPSIQVSITRMPYHMYVNSAHIIYSGIRLARRLNTLLLYRYKEQLKCNHIVSINAEVKFFRKEGCVHYGVCKV
jgi:hypothetical protein